MNAFFIAPAISGVSAEDAASRPTRRSSSGSSSSPGSSRARPADRLTGRLLTWDCSTRCSGAASPTQANLDALFAVPSAAITLQTAAGLQADRRRLGLLPGGRGGGVRADPGRRRRSCSTPTTARTSSAAPTSSASPGCSPAATRTTLSALVTDLHAVNTALEAQGFGPGAAVLAGRVRRRRRAAGSAWSTSTSRARSTRSRRWTAEQRDNALELQVRGMLDVRPAGRAGPPPLDRPSGAPPASTANPSLQPHPLLAGVLTVLDLRGFVQTMRVVAPARSSGRRQRLVTLLG